MDKEHAATVIQKSLRMWHCKKAYDDLLAEKIIKVCLFQQLDVGGRGASREGAQTSR